MLRSCGEDARRKNTQLPSALSPSMVKDSEAGSQELAVMCPRGCSSLYKCRKRHHRRQKQQDSRQQIGYSGGVSNVEIRSFYAAQATLTTRRRPFQVRTSK